MLRVPAYSGPIVPTQLVFVLFLLFQEASTYGQVLEYHTQISAEPGKLVTEKSILIQIPDKSADWLSDISIRYLKSDDIKILEASLLDGQGKVIRSIAKKEIVTRHAISDGIFFSDEWVQEFKAIGPGFPYRIRYRFRVERKKFTQIARWYPLIYPGVSTLNATLQLTTPLDYPVMIEQSQVASFDSAIHSNRITRTWRSEGVGPFRSESYAPSFGEQLPNVSIAPVHFDYVVAGNYSSWKDYGAWEASLLEGTADIPQEERFIIARVLEGATGTQEKMRRLYHYLQDNTRYVAVEVDEGGQKPLPASFVSSKKYGDCKALVVYLRALFLTAGIPSHYAPVYGGTSPVRGARSVPAHRFNHVVLCAPLEGDTVWIEATAGHLPFGYIGTFTQAREALVVNEGNSQLAMTPALTARNVHSHDQYQYTLSKQGIGEVVVTRTYRGEEFEWIRYYQHNKMTREAENYTRQILPLQSFQIMSQHYEPTHRDSAFVQHQLEASLVNQFRKLGRTFAVSPPRFDLPSLDAPTRRQSPVRFAFPRSRTAEISYTIELESDQVIELPANITHSSSHGRYSVVYGLVGSTVTVKKSLLLYAGDYSLEDYPALYSFLDSINKSEKQPFLINRKSP